MIVAPTQSKRLFTFDELATEDGRREYYRVDLKNTDTLRNGLVEPYLNPAFNDDLLERYGCDVHGDQLVKISWAADIRATQFKDAGAITIPYLGRKYPWRGGFRLKVTTGYSYTDTDGNKVTVRTLADVPQRTAFIEEFEYDDLGARKFVVEMKYTLEQMVKMEWCPPPDTPEGEQWCVRNGKRYRVAPDPKGEYIFGFFIEDKDGEYRDVTALDVQGIHDIFNRALNETDEERVTRKVEEWERIQKRMKLKEAEQELISWEEAIVRVENKRRGVVYV